MSTDAGYSSARRPNPGRRAVQPQVAGRTEITSIRRTEPEVAPRMWTGPFTWSSCVRSSEASEAAAVEGVMSPLEASRQEKVTVSPESKVRTLGCDVSAGTRGTGEEWRCTCYPRRDGIGSASRHEWT